MTIFVRERREKMSIERFAKFWLSNICDYPREELREKFSSDSDRIVEGLFELRQLLIQIYDDFKSYESIDDDDMKGYHNLIETLQFIFTIGKVGYVKRDNLKSYLRVDKNEFKKKIRNQPPQNLKY